MNNKLWIFLVLLLLIASSGCLSEMRLGGTPVSSDLSKSGSREYQYQLSATSKDEGENIYGISDRKIISKADFQMEVKNVQAAFDEIINITGVHGGYISDSSIYDTGGRKNGRINLRVPQQNFYSTLREIESAGTVKGREISGQDVTEEFIDLDARLGNLKKQELRLQEILKMATTVKDVLEVEHELERIRGEIERLTGRLNYLNQSVEMSTITVNAMEPMPFTGEDWGIIDAFRQAVKGFIESVRGIIIFTGYILPILIFIGVMIFLALGIKKKVFPKLTGK